MIINCLFRAFSRARTCASMGAQWIVFPSYRNEPTAISRIIKIEFIETITTARACAPVEYSNLFIHHIDDYIGNSSRYMRISEEDDRQLLGMYLWAFNIYPNSNTSNKTNLIIHKSVAPVDQFNAHFYIDYSMNSSASQNDSTVGDMKPTRLYPNLNHTKNGRSERDECQWYSPNLLENSERAHKWNGKEMQWTKFTRETESHARTDTFPISSERAGGGTTVQCMQLI